MPFKSEKQRKFLWANEPSVAKKWTNEHGSKPVKKKKGGTIKKNMGGTMAPKVGAKKFPGTSAGFQQAQKTAKATGQQMTMRKGGKVKKRS